MNNEPVLTHEVSEKLLKALGISSVDKIYSLSINFEGGKAVNVQINKFINDAEFNQFVEVIHKYRLVEVRSENADS